MGLRKVCGRFPTTVAISTAAIGTTLLIGFFAFAGQPPETSPAPSEPQEADHPFEQRIPAPSLSGGVGWINVAGPLDLKHLRGKFVLLDFWTYCCINCMHVLPELKKLERAYPNELVVIGVHTAKFDGEKDSQNIKDAVLRHEIEHPVVNDANYTIWNKYFARSWPSIRVIDPEGFLVAGHSGEIDFATLDEFFKSAIPYYRKQGLLDETPLRFDLERYKPRSEALSYPGKVLADEAHQRLFVADSNHNRIIVCKLGGTLTDVIGSGRIGRTDGDYTHATFDHPQGMALLGNSLYVADTENHLLRKVDLDAKHVTTIAGTGEQSRNPWPGFERDEQDAAEPVTVPQRFVGKPRETALSSPWALWIHGSDLYIAMAGPHQIWKMPLDESEVGPYAGNGREDIVDGPLLPKEPFAAGYASFAQPSGLASDGQRLYVADSEGSSIRAVPFDPQGEARTLVGSAQLEFNRLFAFGDADGTAQQAKLQHPLCVVYYQDVLYVADTYNNKVKAVDPKTGSVTTIAGAAAGNGEEAAFDEPAGLSAAAGKLYVADTNNHRIRTIDLANRNEVATLQIAGLAPPPEIQEQPFAALPGATNVSLEPTEVRSVDGKIRLAVKLSLPQGYKLNAAAPNAYVVAALAATGPVDRQALGHSTNLSTPTTSFEIALPVGNQSGEDRLKVSLTCYYCQEGAEGLCKVASAVWTVPVRIAPNAAQTTVPLVFDIR